MCCETASKKRKTSRFQNRLNTPIQTIRIVMFGLGGVGKTSLVHRFLFNKFSQTYTATIEDDYRQVITHNNHIVDVTVLDTAGSYQFPAMRRHAIQHGHGFVIVYAIDNMASLEEAKRLYNEILDIKDKCPVVLVGNKSDLSPLGKRKVSREDIDKVMLSWGFNATHVETSAKLNENVSSIFTKLIAIIDKLNIAMLTSSSSSSINNNNCTRSTSNLPTQKSDIQRTFSLDNGLDQTNRNKKKKKLFLRKIFSRKSLVS